MQAHRIIQTGRWYVVDRFARTDLEAIVSGPFPTAAAAEQDRRQINIADDCEVVAGALILRSAMRCGAPISEG